MIAGLLRQLLGFFGLSPSSLLLIGGLALGIIAAIGGIYAGVYNKGYRAAAAKCEAAALREEIISLKRDLALAQVEATILESERNDEARAVAARDKVIDAKQKEIDSRAAAGRCPLSGPDADFLSGRQGGKRKARPQR